MLLILLTAGVKSMKSSAGYRHVRSEFYPQFVAKGIDDVRHLTTTVTGEQGASRRTIADLKRNQKLVMTNHIIICNRKAIETSLIKKEKYQYQYYTNNSLDESFYDQHHQFSIVSFCYHRIRSLCIFTKRGTSHLIERSNPLDLSWERQSSRCAAFNCVVKLSAVGLNKYIVGLNRDRLPS